MVVVIPINDLSKNDVVIPGLQEIKMLDKGRLKHYFFKLSVSITYFDASNLGISSDKP